METIEELKEENRELRETNERAMGYIKWVVEKCEKILEEVK